MPKLTIKHLTDLIQAEVSKILDLDTLEEDDDDPRALDNVMKPMRKLAKGLMQEEHIIIREDALLELVEHANLTDTGRAVIDRQLMETSQMNDEQVKSFCISRGYRTYEHFLKSVNALNSAQKGKLG